MRTEAQKEYQRAWQKSEKGKALYARSRARQRAKAALLVSEAARSRGGKCEECGYAWDLVWHHRDPKEKSFGVGSGHTRSPKILLAEIAKCDLLCPNCHARRHRLMPAVSMGVALGLE